MTNVYNERPSELFRQSNECSYKLVRERNIPQLEYQTLNFLLGIPVVGYSRRWVFRTVPYKLVLFMKTTMVYYARLTSESNFPGLCHLTIQNLF